MQTMIGMVIIIIIESCGSSHRGRCVPPPVQLLVAGRPLPIAFCCCCKFSGCPFRVWVCVAPSLPCCCSVTPACASVVRDSKWAATRLDWENKHMEFGLCPPDEVCLANVRCLQTRWGGGGWCACLCRRDTVRSTIFDTWTQHVEAKSKQSRVATSVTAAPPSGGKLSVTMRTPNDLLHQDGDKKM